MSENSAPFDVKAFRAALSAFATGVTIITANDGRDVGVTANSFNSVSLDPPLVLWSLSRTAQSAPNFENAKYFAVHVLGQDQEELSRRFAIRGLDKFAGLDVERGRGDVPLLMGCSARFQCRRVFEHDGGDHVIFVGEVLAFEHEPRSPLLFHAGNYATAAPREDIQASALDEAAAESLDLLITNVYLSGRALSLAQAEQLQLTWSEVYVLAALLDRDGRAVEEVNKVLSYLGFAADGGCIDRLADRGLVRRVPETDLLQLCPSGRKSITALVAGSKAREAEAELRLGPQAALLKHLLKRMLTIRQSDVRLSQHMAVLNRVHDLTDSGSFFT